ncbi:MAG: type IV pilus assembly protein PilM [Deltaproteobacteria bacterium]|nr:type IV pilus assembly protein PilM [Deltaproteobacteria bacterium]
MLFGKTSHLVGLDIGSRSLKAAEIIETKEGRSLKRFGMLDIKSGAIEDAAIKDAETVADSLRQLFNENNIRIKNVAISIGGYSVIVKKITMQAMTDDQLQEAINFEAEQYIPFDISDVNIDYQVLGENENDPDQIDVLLVAAKKDMINDYVNLVRMAGLNPCVIDVDAFALQNIFEANYNANDENIALVDIGDCKTSLNILKSNSSVFIRDVSLGCNMINRKIISLVDCSFEEAEQIKHSNETNKISAEDLREIVSSVVSDWCTEIKRALDFFYSAYPDDQISKIVLSGGGANIKEFRRLLALETLAEVETINPFKNFEVNSKNFDSSYIDKIAPQAAICMGLAIRKVDDK